jgi:hypothetical protein
MCEVHYCHNFHFRGQLHEAKAIIMKLSSMVGVLPLSFSPMLAGAQSFTGSARLTALRSTNLVTADPAVHRVGCLDASGALTLNDCAIFTAEDTPVHNIHSDVGRCVLLWTDNPPFFNCKTGRPESFDGYMFPIVSSPIRPSCYSVSLDMYKFFTAPLPQKWNWSCTTMWKTTNSIHSREEAAHTSLLVGQTSNFIIGPRKYQPRAKRFSCNGPTRLRDRTHYF